MIGECLATAWDDWTESLGVAGFLFFFLLAFPDGRRISGGFMLLVLSSFSALLQNRYLPAGGC